MTHDRSLDFISTLARFYLDPMCEINVINSKGPDPPRSPPGYSLPKRTQGGVQPLDFISLQFLNFIFVLLEDLDAHWEWCEDDEQVTHNFVSGVHCNNQRWWCPPYLQKSSSSDSTTSQFRRKNHGFWLFTVYPLLWPLSWLDQKGGFELLEVSEKITKRRLWMATAWHINSVNDGIMFGNPSKNNVGWSYCCTQSFGPETFENCFKFCSAGLHCESSPLEISPLERKDHTWTAEHWVKLGMVD